MMRSDQVGTIKAFATVRFVGERLIPSELTETLKVQPRRSYMRGDRFVVGSRQIEQVRKNGLWMFSTDFIPAPKTLSVHVDYVRYILTRDHADDHLKSIIEEMSLRFVVTLFWHGERGHALPEVSPSFLELIAFLHGEVKRDFAFEEDGKADRFAAA